MDVTLRIPDAIAAHLTQGGEDLSRRALEAFALEELRAGRITESELGEMLELARIQNYSLEDFEREREPLKNLGF